MFETFMKILAGITSSITHAAAAWDFFKFWQKEFKILPCIKWGCS
jgi:hypothetical protein